LPEDEMQNAALSSGKNIIVFEIRVGNRPDGEL